MKMHFGHFYQPHLFRFGHCWHFGRCGFFGMAHGGGLGFLAFLMLFAAAFIIFAFWLGGSKKDK